jgi:signal transduction histidine kinase
MNLRLGFWLLLSLAPAAMAQDAEVPASLLTNIQQVVTHTNDATSLSSFSARVRGVVTYLSPPTRRLYVQDGEHAVQVNLIAPVTSFRAGQLVEVEGKIGAGLPLPRIYNAAARVIGKAPLPEAKLSSAGQLANGQDPFRLVTFHAFVRDMTLDRGVLTLLLADDWRNFEMAVLDFTAPLPREWIDAQVEVRGIAYPFYNSRNQPTGFRFHAPSPDHVRVTKTGVGKLFDRPTMTIAEASRQPWEWQPRVKIVGTVTAHQPVDTLFVDDGTGAMQVNLMGLLARPEGAQFLEHDAQVWLQPGERVEVIGVRRNWSAVAPTLIQAEFRRAGKAPLVAPLRVSIEDLKAGRFAGRVVSIEARLLDARFWNTGNVRHENLVLQAGDKIFQAAWESETPAEWRVRPGSYVRVTGVNDAMQSNFKEAHLFQILLRSPNDVVAAPAPPFWTRPEFRRVALGAGIVGLIAGAWILLQRHQMRRLELHVAERTSELRGEVAAREEAQENLRVALAAEKELNELKSSFVSMVSHEFRTPLEVILSSSNILDRYLDRLPADKRKAQLRAIRKSVHRMNDLVEDVLMLGKLESGRLTCQPTSLQLEPFCRRLADEIESAAAREGIIRLSADGVDDTANADEGLLYHVLGNLLSNAVKYSPPDQLVDFTIGRRGSEAEFVIRDRGCGIPKADGERLFTPFSRGSNVGHAPGTGLGLAIVKRCLDLHDGTVRCESEEGKGTAFIVTMPLFDGAHQFRRKPQVESISA